MLGPCRARWEEKKCMISNQKHKKVFFIYSKKFVITKTKVPPSTRWNTNGSSAKKKQVNRTPLSLVRSSPSPFFLERCSPSQPLCLYTPQGKAKKKKKPKRNPLFQPLKTRPEHSILLPFFFNWNRLFFTARKKQPFWSHLLSERPPSILLFSNLFLSPVSCLSKPTLVKAAAFPFYSSKNGSLLH